MEVRFHRLAIREYEDRRTWYESRREGLGDAFATRSIGPSPVSRSPRIGGPSPS